MQGLEAELRGAALVVTCPGEVTFENTAEIRSFVDGKLAKEEYSIVVLDLSGVTFMDSSGIGTLVALNSKVYSGGKKFYLLSPTPQVLKTLELVKLSDFFDFINNPDELDLVSC